MNNQLLPLSSLMTLDDIPAVFDPIKQAATSFFGNIYFRNLHFERSTKGDAVYYKLILVLNDTLSLKIGGTPTDPMVEVVFMPDAVSGTTTEIPIQLDVQWEIFALISKIKNFSVDSFSNAPQEVFDLLLDILGLEENDLIAATVNNLVDGGTDFSSSLNAFIDAVNVEYTTNIAYPSSSATTEEALLQTLVSIQQIVGKTIFEVVYETFIEDIDLDEALSKIEQLFVNLLGGSPLDYLQRLLIPRIKAIVTLGAPPPVATAGIGVIFSRELLTPIDPATNEPFADTVLPAPRSMIEFDFGDLIISTEEGIHYREEITAGLNYESQIGKTGLRFNITGAKLDLSENSNIPEATLYGKPDSFKGVYIEEAVIKLPPKIFSDGGGATLGIVGKNLLIGTGGFTGTLGLQSYGGTPLQAKLPGDMLIAFESFYISFLDGSVTDSSLKGSLTVQASGTPHVIVLEGLYTDTGFSIKASGQGTTPLVRLPLGDFGALFLSEITIGSENGAFFLSLKAGLEYSTDFPVVDRFLPNPLLLEQFKVSSNGIEEFALNLTWDDIGQNFIQSLAGESEQVIPVGWDLFDVLFINALTLRTSLDLGATLPRFSSKALIDGALQLGPLYASVGDVGAEMSVTYVEDTSNPAAPTNATYLGPLALEGRFVPPSKIVLKIDAKKVTGGGAIWLDYDNQRYSGALNLNIADQLNLTAIGIIAFKAPDGSKLFSFLAIITAEFPPLHITSGFWLTGAGGMMGLHRGMDPDFLRQGIKTGLLDNILFPSNPLENFSSLVTGLESAFPITQGQFIIGPMLQIRWGGQSKETQLMQLEIGLIIELPNPVRIALPGVVKTLLPKADSDIISVKAAFIAILDFGAKLFSLDASLFDSHILKKFTLSGDIAVRIGWGNNAMFILSVGGFHPEYTQVPPGLTGMRRMSISILDKPKASVRLEAYLAITSNSVQLGARAHLIFATGKNGKGLFRVLGYVYFDALLQFNPFMLVIEIGAGISLEFKGTPILAINLLFRLEGPTPWRVKGKAMFTVLGFELSVKFDHTFGERRVTTVPDVDLMPLIVKALKEPDAWRSLPPARSSIHNLVSIQAQAGQEEVLLLQPFGQLSVVQSIAPLETTLNKHGEQNLLGGEQYFHISRLFIVQANMPVALDTLVVNEDFARAQYEDMNEAEKLSAPAFETFPAGVQLDNQAEATQVSNAEVLLVAYEHLLLEEETNGNGDVVLVRHERADETPTAEEFTTLLGNHAAANSPLSAQEVAPAAPIRVTALRYFVVTKATLQTYAPAHATAPAGYPRSRAEEWLRQLRQTDPQAAMRLQVVPASELVVVQPSTTSPPTASTANTVDALTLMSL